MVHTESNTIEVTQHACMHYGSPSETRSKQNVLKTQKGENIERQNQYDLVTIWASLVAQLVKNLPAMQEIPVQFLDLEDLLENMLKPDFHKVK